MKQEKVTTLGDFMGGRGKEQKERDRGSSRVSQGSSLKWGKGSQRSVGLETLLHFNQNDSLSSVGSRNRQEKSTWRQEDSRFGNMMGEARREIEELRLKRLQMEQDWKQTQQELHDNRAPFKKESISDHQSSQVVSQLDESQVDSYNEDLQRSVYPRHRQVDCEADEDGLVVELRRDILRDRLQQFTTHIKRYGVMRLGKEVKLWNQLADFKRRREFEGKQMVFCSWKEAIECKAERQKLRRMIVNRIQKRKQLQQLSNNVEDYTKTL